MNKRNTRMVAILMSVLMVIGAVAGISWVGVLAEDADTYTVDDNWRLLTMDEVNAVHANACREEASYDAENKVFNSIGQGAVIEVKDVDFGTGKQSIELDTKVSKSANKGQTYIFIGEENYKACIPQVRYVLQTSDDFSWIEPLYCDLSGFTGKQTVYIVGANTKGGHSSIKGFRFAEAKDDGSVVYSANPNTWSTLSGNAKYGMNIISATYGDMTNNPTVLVKGIDFTGMVGIELITSARAERKVTLSVGDTVLGETTTVKTSASHYAFFEPAPVVDITDKNLTGVQDLTIAIESGQMTIAAIRMIKGASQPEESQPEESQPEESQPDPVDSDIYPVSDNWRLLTMDEVNAVHANACREEASYDAENKVFNSIGQGAVIEVKDVDFGTGKQSIELDTKVSKSANKGQTYIFIGEENYKACIPQVRYVLQTSDDFSWIEPLYCDLTGFTGKQTVYIVGANTKGGHSSIRGFRFAEAKNDGSVVYSANPNTWSTLSGNAKYGMNIISATYGDMTNDPTVLVKGIDFTGMVGIELITSARAERKVTLSVGGTVLGETTTVKTSTTHYAFFEPTPVVDITDKNLTGVQDLTIAIESGQMTIAAIRMIKGASQPEESQPEESQPEESQPEESQPEESQPEESQPEESQPDPVDPDTYPVNGNWRLLTKDEIEKTHPNVCADEGVYDADAKVFDKVGKGTVIEVQKVDFGTGKQSLELNLKVSAGANRGQIFVFVGKDSYEAVDNVPQARFVLTACNDFTWTEPTYCDLTGITGEQTVYIVGANFKGRHSSVKGLRFAEAKDDSKAYAPNPDTWDLSGSGAVYNGKIISCTVGGNKSSGTIVVKDVDFTGWAGIQVIGSANGAKKLTLSVDDQKLGMVKVNTGNDSFYEPTEAIDISDKNLTGKHDLTITSEDKGFNITAIRMLKTVPKKPNLYTPEAETWKLLTKDEVNQQFPDTCKDAGSWKEGTKVIAGIGEGTVIKITDVDFSTGKQTLELSLTVPESAVSSLIYVYIGDESYTAQTHVPQVRFLLEKSDFEESEDGFAWVTPLSCDLSGIIGKQTVYIVGAGNEGNCSSLNGLRFTSEEKEILDVIYAAHPTDWDLNGSVSYAPAVNKAVVDANQDGEKTVTLKDVDLTGAEGLKLYTSGDKATFTVQIDDTEIGQLVSVKSGDGLYVLSEKLSLKDSELTGKHTVTLKTNDQNFRLLAVDVEINPDILSGDPEGTYTARVPKWRIVPKDEHGIDDRGAAVWDAEQKLFSGVGRGTILEISNVDFKDGYNFMELLLSVPENCHERFINVFIDDYTTGDPAARFYMTKTEEGEFEWQGQFCENFSTVTGRHKVYIVGATDDRGYNFRIKALRLSKVTVTEEPIETVYAANPRQWFVIGGLGGAYLNAPNACGIGKNNEALLRIDGIDFTGVTGISLLVGCHGDDKAVTFYGKDPVKYFDEPMELGTLLLPPGDYSHFVWSDYTNITGMGMTGVRPLYIQSLGSNFEYRALRTTKKDLGPAEGPADSESVVGDESSEAEDPADNPDTGAAAAALPVMLALASAAAIPAIRRKRSR